MRVTMFVSDLIMVLHLILIKTGKIRSRSRSMTRILREEADAD